MTTRYKKYKKTYQKYEKKNKDKLDNIRKVYAEVNKEHLNKLKYDKWILN